MNIGENIKNLRISRKIVQVDLAKLLGLSQSTITKIENNERRADNDTLKKLAEYFYVSTDYLLGREPLSKQLQYFDSVGEYLKQLRIEAGMAVPEVIEAGRAMYGPNSSLDLNLWSIETLQKVEDNQMMPRFDLLSILALIYKIYQHTLSANLSQISNDYKRYHEIEEKAFEVDRKEAMRQITGGSKTVPLDNDTDLVYKNGTPALPDEHLEVVKRVYQMAKEMAEKEKNKKASDPNVRK